jgi:fermentation-respiration switch protein FrsA (DUF1100 family)
MLKFLLIPVALYLAVIALVWALQARILFPTGMIGDAGPLPPGAERLSLGTPDGHRLHGILIPPAQRATRAPVILGFGGNAWNAEAAAAFLHDLYPEAEIVAFHYRGYRPSAGTPGAAALVADAPLVYDLAAARFPGRPVVAIGFSVGSGIAASLAPRRPLAGLILVTPFDSLAQVAADHYRWLPVRFLFRHEMPAAEWLERAPVPTAILAGGADTLIPARRTAALRRRVRNLVFDRTVAGAGHNDIYENPAFRAAMREALVRLTAVREPPPAER